MPNSANVGKAQERAIVNHAKANGFPYADRIIRTGAGKDYAVRPDEGDIWLCPGVIIQSKRLKDAAKMERLIPAWLTDTEQQRVAAKANYGVLVVRRFGIPNIDKWWAWFHFTDLASLVTDGAIAPRADTIPVRLTVADAYTLLRAAGYGTPSTEVPHDRTTTRARRQAPRRHR